jgi:hypothetical protein
MRLERSVKKPQRYRRFVQWDTVENHRVDFRGSADFQEWRSRSATASLRRRTSSTWLRCCRGFRHKPPLKFEQIR